MEKIAWKPLLIAIAIPLVLVGGGSALATMNAMEQYGAIQKPMLSPPGWLFPVVWSILFLLMGIASYLVWRSDSPNRGTALTVYGIQLAFNFLWILVFFCMRSYGLSVGILLLLWLLILITTVLFYRIDHTTLWLMLPYLLWVTFAGYLNIGVAVLNGGLI